MNTSTAETKERLSITVLSVVLAASNVGFLWMVNRYTDVLQRIF